jgi:hypothetical protein
MGALLWSSMPFTISSIATYEEIRVLTDPIVDECYLGNLKKDAAARVELLQNYTYTDTTTTGVILN